MKKIGQIQMGENTWVYQYDELSHPLNLKSPIKTAVCDTPDNIWVKVGKKDTDWVKSTKRLVLVDIHDWFLEALDFNKKELSHAEAQAFAGILTFKQGDLSDQGTKLVESLKKDFELQGLTPNIMYVPSSEVNGMSENCIYQHQFSQTTLLLKHKKLPLLVIANGNLDLNTSRLIKNKNGMNKQEILLNGITG